MKSISPRSAIKAVYFDIGNVLLHFNARRIARDLAWAVGRHPLKVARFLWSSELGVRIEKGELGPRELYRLFCDELDYEGDYAAFKKLWCDHFILDRKAAALLKTLSRRMPVYLLSNTNVLHYEFIRRRYAFPRHARGAVLSYRLGLRKPEPAIYRAALRLGRVKPGEAVFIDDLEVNVAAARAQGWTGLRYRGADGLRRDLQELGLL